MKDEGLPQIQILRGGTKVPWCSIMCSIKREHRASCDVAELRNLLMAMHVHPGYLNFSMRQRGQSLIFDLEVDPTLPKSHVEKLQKLFAKHMEKALCLRVKVVAFFAPPIIGRF